MMSIPEFVRYIGLEDSSVGLKCGDVVKVLSAGVYKGYLYVEVPIPNSLYYGDDALDRKALEGKNFTYFTDSEYELIKEEEKVDKHKFKVGDIVCGNSSEYSYTNRKMTKGVVQSVSSDGQSIKVEIKKHIDNSCVGMSYWVRPQYFDLVVPETPVSLYYITTDMKTFVDVKHGENEVKTKCNLTIDEFDIHYGIDLALERLDEVENPPAPEPIKELPKYVKYLGNGSGDMGGLLAGDICRVLGSAPENSVCPSSLYVSCPNPTSFHGGYFTEGQNFTYLWPEEYEPVDFAIHG